MKKNKVNQKSKTKKVSGFNKYNNLSEVEKLVDEIIIKNKEKLEKYRNEDIDTNRFSLKNKNKDYLFYLKKINKKTSEKKLSSKIISQARENLGEEPLSEEEVKRLEQEIDNFKQEPIDKKTRKKFFARKNKGDLADISDTKTHKTEDLLESDEFDEVVDEIEKAIKIDVNKDENDSEFLEEKIELQSEKEEKKDYLETAEKKAEILVKEHDLSSKKESLPKSKIIDKKQDILFSDETQSNIKKEDEEESKLIDEEIKKTEWAAKPESQETLEEIDKKSDLFTEKKFTLKKDKSVQKKEAQVSDTSKPFFKPRFRVDNIPRSEKDSEHLFIDKNLKKNKIEGKPIDDFKEIEEKAQKLAQEHIKDLPKSEKNPQMTFDNKNKGKSTAETINSLQKDDGNQNEHVFFDENEGSSFSGWSPSVSEKEKRTLPLNNKSELDIETNVGEIRDIELPKEVLNVDSVTLSDLGFSETEWEELDFYPLVEPFAFVEILRERETLEKCYFLVEAELTEEEDETLEYIQDTITRISISTEELEATGNDDYLSSQVQQVIKEYNLKIADESLNKILYYLSKSSLGLDKIDPLMNDPNIEDISCDGSGVPLFLYHRQFGSLKSNIKFETEDELGSFIFKLAQKCGKHISIADPILDATMPDGSRIQMTLSDEITAHGSTFTIRKFRADPFSPPDLIEFNTMSAEMLAYMWLAVENGINMLFAGGTASGKTTTLNAVSLFIPPESKIVSIEETREINLPHPNWIPGVARSGFGQVVSDKVVGEIDMYDLMKAALRQRPEYILVGEIRGREAYVLFQAMATGHATYSTVHADSAHSLIHRLEGKPINIPRVMLQSLDVVSLHVITKVKNKRARRCKQIIEIIDIDPTTKEILTNEVFRWDPVEDKFVYSGKSYVLERIRAEKDMSREDMTDELKRRTNLVDSMNQKNVREFKDVARFVSKYLENPGEVIKQFQKDENRKGK